MNESLTNIFPVFIPTKGRPNPKTTREIPNSILVVEPQEANEYHVMNPHNRILVLPSSDKGVAFARQSILDYSRAQNFDYFWIVDDDLTAFYRFENRKSIRIPGLQALEGAEKIFLAIPRLGQGCLNNCQYAWAADRVAIPASSCTACVFVNVKATKKINYDLSLNMKEDIDFSIKVLNQGLNSVRLNKFGYSTGKVGTQAGGLKPLYDDPSNDLKASQNIVDRWGSEFCKVVAKRTGRVDVRVNWRALAERARQSQQNFQPELGTPLFENMGEA